MATATRNRSRHHLRALTTSAALAGFFREMYRPSATMVHPSKVIRILKKAKVRFVLMGVHGLSAWRSRPRATEDVDVLIAKKDHTKAVNAVQMAFPKLIMEDFPVVTRFKDPATGEARIDLMKPSQKVFQMVFRYTQQVGASHRIPDLEMALTSKFAAMVSPNRETERKIQDAADFANMVVHNGEEINMTKLARLADQVYSGGRNEIVQLVENILAGRPIQI